jgi:hypothetical protein
MTTPRDGDIETKAELLRKAWDDVGRPDRPQLHALALARPTPELLRSWENAGVSDVVWGLPDRSASEVTGYIRRLADRLGIG